LVLCGGCVHMGTASFHAPKNTQIYIRSRDDKDMYVQLATGACWKDADENKWLDEWEHLAIVDVVSPRKGGTLQPGIEVNCQIVLGVAHVENGAPWTNRAMRTYEVYERLAVVDWVWDDVDMCIGIVKSFRKVGGCKCAISDNQCHISYQCHVCLYIMDPPDFWGCGDACMTMLTHHDVIFTVRTLLQAVVFEPDVHTFDAWYCPSLGYIFTNTGKRVPWSASTYHKYKKYYEPGFYGDNEWNT
jgi:hypothetical protein